MRRRFSSASFLVDMSVWFAKRCYTHQRLSTPGLNASAAQVLEYEPRDKGDEPLPGFPDKMHVFCHAQRGWITNIFFKKYSNERESQSI